MFKVQDYHITSECMFLFILEPRKGVTIIIINSDVSLINDCVILLLRLLSREFEIGFFF